MSDPTTNNPISADPGPNNLEPIDPGPNDPTPPIFEGTPIGEDQRRLRAFFDELEIKQLDFLDQAGKRIIELTTGLLGLFFTVTAIGSNFPPAYLQDNLLATGLAIATLALYILAMITAVIGVQPQSYGNYEYNISAMRAELEKMVSYKSGCFQLATLFFLLASIALALLVGVILTGVSYPMP